MDGPEQDLGTLIPVLSDLADWLDRHYFPITAESVRDWHVERDGPWRPYAAALARLPELKTTSTTAPMARTLLRMSQVKLEHFFGH